jgi:hypothetical protein
MKTFKKALGLLFAAILITNCGVQKASVELDTKAKGLTAPSGKAIVYIVRPSSLGFAVKFTVNCNDKYIGATGGQRFIYTILDPGKYLFTSKAENKAELEVTVEADKIYFIDQIPQMGIMKARNKLELITEAEGREKLKTCKLSVDCAELKTSEAK